MRIRVNYTIEIDPDQYRDANETDMTKDEIRKEVQEQSITDTMYGLWDRKIGVRLLGRNNVYDKRQKLTVAEHNVT